MKYTIKLFKGMSQYNAYEGTSYTSAAKMVDTLRATLILAGGTAEIAVSLDGGYNTPLYQVADGFATPVGTLERK